jgi:hypothetical protein
LGGVVELEFGKRVLASGHGTASLLRESG